MNRTFLSCDWGTSFLRLRLINVDSLIIIEEAKSEEGIASVYKRWQQQDSEKKDRIGFYKAVLQNHIALLEYRLNTSLNGIAIIMSGMVSASIGMIELPYRPLPFSISGTDLYVEKIKATSAFEHDMLIISGVRTDRDVMRGEETQLIGCTPETNNSRQVFIFPGTHSKHIHVEDGQATDFQTYMTGEFFHLLSKNSILSESVSSGGSFEKEENASAFEEGLLDSQQQSLLHASFMVRTNSLFKRFSKQQNYWYLSGLVIGAELNELFKKQVQAVFIASEGVVGLAYEKAFEALGAYEQVQSINSTEALIKAHRNFFLTMA